MNFKPWRTVEVINDVRPGSALLVVLGMLSFMLFSGLAFSVYMRQSRLPSSFLRRTSSTRQLAKAALAEAMDEIDRAIGNDPHPGIRMKGKDYQEGLVDNVWSHRVFFGWTKGNLSDGAEKYDLVQSPDKREQSGSDAIWYVDPEEQLRSTESTLTLEGLAYVPPNLINEARYYSQRTPTARWHSFWFDSGRYVYTAIDVSDYFDVNRISATLPRAACASRRLSFSHLFEEGVEHKSLNTSALNSWETVLKQFRTLDDKRFDFDDQDYPCISLAQLNLAFKSTTFGNVNFPFINFLSWSGNGGSAAYQPLTDSAFDDEGNVAKPDAGTFMQMTFVTDGLFPSKKDKNGKDRLTLEDPNNQPFKYSSLKKSACAFPNLDDMADTGGMPYSPAGAKKWLVGDQGGLRLNIPNMVALWDYLDEDMIPASLCVPTVERTPMICGIKQEVFGNIDLRVSAKPDSQSETKVEKAAASDGNTWDFYTREVTYSLDVSALQSAIGKGTILTTYPFIDHGVEDPQAKWTLDGRLSFFLSTGGTFPMRFSEDNFTAAPKKADFKKTELTDNSLISYYMTAQDGDLKPSGYPSSSRNELGMLCVPSPMGRHNELSNPEFVIVKVKYKWNRDIYLDDKGNPDPNGTPTMRKQNPDPLDADTTAEIVSDGNIFPLFNDGYSANNKAKSAQWNAIKNDLADKKAVPLKLNLAVWARIADSQGNTVDFVPACHVDDANMNDADMDMKCSRECGGSGKYPMMRVEAADAAGTQLELSLAKMQSGSLGTVAFPDFKWVISDPRYNYAPENWVQKNGALQAKDDWQDNGDIQAMVKAGDGDACMSTSDAGYMQSVYELAFLPRVAEGFKETLKFTSEKDGNQFSADLGKMFNGQFATAHTTAKDADFMWRTYNPMGRYRNDEFEDLEDVFEARGMAVNPYSNSTNVLMAAFANTPYDWRVAATADYTRARFGIPKDAASFNQDFAWNGYKGKSKEDGALRWDCLEEFAGEFQRKVRLLGDWEDAFADLDWSVDKRKILDSMGPLDNEDSDLYSVDKKFLYGFWHDCFAARQQLFLIFVRAEPMMMGGGVSGQVPPQLSSRAVALVWRDPTATGENRTGNVADGADPHRMRILFYHQFD